MATSDRSFLHSEAIPTTREAEAIGDVLGRALGRGSSDRFDRNLRATSAWLMSNGDLERSHTVKVWLRDASRQELDPIMVVEVDSHSLVSDFNAKRDVYLGRLAFYGQRVSRLEFRFAMRGVSSATASARAGGVGIATAPSDPTQADMSRADELAAAVPEPLRDVVRAAVAASLVRTRMERRAAGATKPDGG